MDLLPLKPLNLKSDYTLYKQVAQITYWGDCCEEKICTRAPIIKDGLVYGSIN